MSTNLTTDGDDAERDGMTVSVTNVGGIDDCDVSFDPGISILSGRNATNRTSFLTAVAGALGGNAATLKSDADTGRVELTVDGETYTREYRRQGPTVSVEGEPYSEEADVVDLFGALLRDNPARQAVERGEDLREIIMRPVDRDRIRAEIRDLESERQRVDRRLDEIERERKRLPGLEERKADLEEELASVVADVESLREEIEAYDAGEEEAERAEELVSDLESLRQERRRIETDIETQEATLADLREEREGAETDLEALTVREDELEELDRALDRLKERRRALGETVNDLAAIVEFNEDVVAGSLDLPEAESDDVTAALDPASETVECLTCGSRVERSDMAAKLDELRALVEEKRAERKRVEEEITSRRERRDDLRADADRRAELERRVEEVDRELERREQRIEDLRAERERVEADVADLEERVEATEQLRESDLVAKHRRLNELEYERGQLEQELDDVTADIESLVSLAEERGQLTDQRAELDDEIASLRSQIEETERDAVEQFNDHMEELLALLDYGNIARVWIERKAESARSDGARFDLHVVREADDGAVYEDRVENLSESERQVVGLVVALAGYLVHEVHEVVPVVLLDSLEAIDADRIAALVEYFAEFAPYLVVALLPEDEQALSDEYDRVPAERLGG